MLNTISLRGILMDDMTTTASVGGGKTYHGTVAVQRLSGTVDYLPIVIEGAKFPNLHPFFLTCDRVTITGEIRTYTRNDQEVGHRHKACVFVQSIYKAPDGVRDDQLLALEGALCKDPVYRVTPNGREICELMVACNVGAKASYIPVIVWGFSARKMAGAQTGDLVEISGRFQSRKYEKKLDFTGESGEPVRVWRTAYEVSAKTCRVIGMQRRLKAE